MSTLSANLVTVAKAGGSIKISANSYLTANIVTIAKALIPQSKLILTDCETQLTANLAMIAKAAPGQVVFEFND